MLHHLFARSNGARCDVDGLRFLVIDAAAFRAISGFNPAGSPRNPLRGTCRGATMP